MLHFGFHLYIGVVDHEAAGRVVGSPHYSEGRSDGPADAHRTLVKVQPLAVTIGQLTIVGTRMRPLEAVLRLGFHAVLGVTLFVGLFGLGIVNEFLL